MTDLIAQLHRKAMNLASRAYMAKLHGNVVEADALRRKAFVQERRAALMLLPDMKAEPTRSVLFRSAATLALNCGELREAERLAAMGLSGNGPNEICEELRDVLEQVHFGRHLEVRGVVLEPNDFQMALAGESIGLGVAEVVEILPRAQSVERSYHRLIERKKRRRFRGSVDRKIQRENPFSMTIPRAASFAVSFQVGRQMELPVKIVGDTSDLIDELLECFDLYENGDAQGLRALIDDDDYYNNFVGLARQVAPDGANVSMVGFTFARGRDLKKVSLTKRNADVKLLVGEPNRERAYVADLGTRTTVTGVLRFADDLSHNSRIRIIHGREKQTIIVPPGTMDDVVRPLWGRKVIVEGTKTRKGIVLDDIREVPTAEDGD